MATDPEIFIDDLRLSVALGCTAEERAFPQIISVDISYILNSEIFLSSDSITDTLDYGLVISRLEEIAISRSWNLLEKMCHDFVNEILALSPLVSQTTVKCKKFVFPQCSGIVCSISRSNGDASR